MRKIPVVINGDLKRLVGYLYLDDAISDAEVVESTVSWCIMTTNRQLIEAALVPKLHAVPLDRCAYCGNPVIMTAKDARCGFVDVHAKD